MNNLFFQEWLGIKVPYLDTNRVINPSLTLSELFWIKKIRTVNPYLVPLYYNGLLAIPIKDKSDDLFMINYYQQTIEKHLYQFDDTWRLCNKFLSLGNQLVLPSAIDSFQRIKENEMVLSFSQTQVEVLTTLISQSQNLIFRLGLTKSKIRMKLTNLKRKFY